MKRNSGVTTECPSYWRPIAQVSHHKNVRLLRVGNLNKKSLMALACCLASQPIYPGCLGRSMQFWISSSPPAQEFWQKRELFSVWRWLYGTWTPGAKFFLLRLWHIKPFLCQAQLSCQQECRQIGSCGLRGRPCLKGVSLSSEEWCLSGLISVGWGWVTWAHRRTGAHLNSAFYCFFLSNEKLWIMSKWSKFMLLLCDLRH